jgi:hypothetical protein
VTDLNATRHQVVGGPLKADNGRLRNDHRRPPPSRPGARRRDQAADDPVDRPGRGAQTGVLAQVRGIANAGETVATAGDPTRGGRWSTLPVECRTRAVVPS